jgi:hypothetical protein
VLKIDMRELFFFFLIWDIIAKKKIKDEHKKEAKPKKQKKTNPKNMREL